jgi:DNA-binding transcriptional MerR regulator
MTVTIAPSPASSALSISEVAALTGLSQDTLRWYEREGLVPPVERGNDRRRRYSGWHVSLLQILVRLRRTGMATKEVRRFSQLVAGGAATHGARMALLRAHRDRLVRQIEQLRDDLAGLDAKIEHYRYLIDAGLDCDGRPVDAITAARQRNTSPPEHL